MKENVELYCKNVITKSGKSRTCGGFLGTLELDLAPEVVLNGKMKLLLVCRKCRIRTSLDIASFVINSGT